MKNSIGSFFLGRSVSDKKNFTLESKDLCTHAVCMGMTGSGKTGLGIGLLEEAALDGIPAIIIDPKGDLGNLLLAFPELLPSDFAPWIDEAEAARNGLSLDAYAQKVASDWTAGLKSWDEDKPLIKSYKDSVERTIYTPANKAGTPLSILNSFSAPSDEILNDEGAFRDRILSTTSSLLGLIGIKVDPIQSKEHILISTILENVWKNKESIDIESLIRQIQNPPFNQVGVFSLDTFFPQKERLSLAMSLNNLLAAPGFQAWMEGAPIDIQKLLYTNEGKPRHSIIYIAHLSDSERMFFVTLLLNELLSWVRKQPGTSTLRALFYMDEIFGFFPATSSPPSKLPMIALLKQARAFGLGIVLSTQNPVDLDYRGLSNIGTWFIGKLQTERDRSRIIEGLESASNGDMSKESLENLLSQCKKRNFLTQSIHAGEPKIFETRWTLSYLAGPLTLPQIHKLTGTKEKILKFVEQVTDKKKPILPAGVKEFVLKKGSSESPFKPFILGTGKLHFVDSSNKLDAWVDRLIIAPLTDDGKNADFVNSDPFDINDTPLSTDIAANSLFEDVPASLFAQDFYKNASKSFLQYLYQNATLDLYKIDLIKLVSKTDETIEKFKERAAPLLEEKKGVAIEKIKGIYQDKILSLEDKIRRAKERQAKIQEKSMQKKWDAFMSFLKAIVAGLFSRKALSKGNISNMGTSLKKIGNSVGTSTPEDDLSAYEEQVSILRLNQNQELEKVSADFDIDKVTIDKITIRPRKTDLLVEGIAILWK